MTKIKITIGIIIFNEGKNIKNLLTAILSQKETNFVINDIIVMSDGSTDNSLEEVRSISNPKIKLIAYQKRMGLAYRINQMCQAATGDYLVKFDGDILPKDNELLSNLFKSLPPNTQLIAGGREPFPSTKFIGQVHNFGDYVWYLTRKDLFGGNNIHNHNGVVDAMSKKLYKSIKIPTGYYGLDDFIYLQNLRLKGKFHFVHDAVIYYKNPDTFSDYFKQQRRFTSSRERLIKFFGSWINKVYVVPQKYKIRASIKAFLTNPLMFLSFLVIHTIIQIKINMSGYTPPGYGWDITESTKNISDIKNV